MMMQMVGAFAEFERAMIRERTAAGLAAARAAGHIGVRRKELDAAKRREIAESVISDRKTGADGAALQHQRADRVTHRRSAPRRESAHAPSPRLWTRAPDAFFDCQPSITGLAHQLF
jgi:DNA invertase Pin-like site-specific DNA recombinase